VGRSAAAIFTVLVLLTSAAAGPKPGDPGTPEYTRAADLVKQLEDARFAAREAAGKQLVEMGQAAAPALRDGQKAADEEVRTRCAALLPKALAFEWAQKAAAFLADPDGKGRDGLPLWKECQTALGPAAGEPGGRKLYAEMLRTNGELLAAIAADRKAGVPALHDRAAAVLGKPLRTGTPDPVAAGDLLALLFADRVLGWERMVREDPLTNLFDNPGWRDALDHKEFGPAARRLVAAWIDVWVTPAGKGFDGQKVYWFLGLVYPRPFAEAVPALARIAANTKASARDRYLAAVMVMDLDAKEALRTLRGVVSDEATVHSEDGVNFRLGDCLLGAWLQKQKRELKAYDLFCVREGRFAITRKDSFTIELCTFATAEDRTRGVQKWKDEVAGRK
jgi:hypothetical protein